jgi:hypothetical protein
MPALNPKKTTTTTKNHPEAGTAPSTANFAILSSTGSENRSIGLHLMLVVSVRQRKEATEEKPSDHRRNK